MQICGKCTVAQIGPISNGYVTHLVCILSTPPVKDSTRNRPCPKSRPMFKSVNNPFESLNYSCNYEVKHWLKTPPLNTPIESPMVVIFLRLTHLWYLDGSSFCRPQRYRCVKCQRERANATWHLLYKTELSASQFCWEIKSSIKAGQLGKRLEDTTKCI